MVRFLISTTEELREELKNVADRQGQTLCGLVRQILWEWVKREGQRADVPDASIGGR